MWLSRSAIRNRHSIDPHGAGNIIDLLLAQILKAKGQPGSRTIGCQPLGRRALRVAFFCDSNIDWPVAAVPTCVGPDKPPKYPATYYTEYMIRYQQRTYNVFGADGKDAAQ